MGYHRDVTRTLPAGGVAEVVISDDATAKDFDVRLPDDEERAVARFATTQLRARARAARTLLRLVAASYLGCDPAEVPIRRAACAFCGGEHGKPVVGTAPMHANLSHAGSAVAVAVASAEVGVDIELPERTGDVVRLASRFFSPDETAWVADAVEVERDLRFLRLWVRKEALLKATGEGISGGLASVGMLDPLPARLERPTGSLSFWTVADLPASVPAVGAVALSGERLEVRIVSLEELGLS